MTDVWMLPTGTVENRGPIAKWDQEADADPDQWFACRHPERPFDTATALHDCCGRCLIAVTAAVANGYAWSTEGSSSVVDALAARLDEYGEAPDAD